MKALVQYQLRAFTSFFFVCWVAIALSQPKANFSSTPSAGCSPLVVHFTDSSSGGSTNWKWDLGNGAVSYLRNPSATYFNPGTYTVKLVVSNANGADSVIKKEYITVYAAPVPAFALDKASGCFPLPVQFTDSSLAGSGTIASWQWDFGDGTISSTQHPVHTYTSPGDFTLTLRVTTSFGCAKTVSKEGAVKIAEGVKVAFTNTSPGPCAAPARVQFTNQSTGPGPLSFQWQFGDGSISTAVNPEHDYTANGQYSVRLIATSPQGCADTVKKDSLIAIGSAKAILSLPTVGCVDEAVNFKNSPSPAPVSVQWDFGDGTFSSNFDPVKIYTLAGNYTVRLISNFGTCSDTIKKQLAVMEKPQADFSIRNFAACSLPVDVQFQSSTTGAGYKYQWDFGDSTTSDMPAPTHTYTKEGSFTVKLIVTNAGGCSDTIIKKDLIKIQKPQLQITGLPKTGCVPNSITPSAAYTNGQSISRYFWNFGDGNTSTAVSPVHTYTNPGTYTVSLVATTTEGCTDTLMLENAVRLGLKPAAAFENRPTFACPFENVAFTDKSTGHADQWFWNFGDGGTSTEQSPYHQFSDTGWQNVVLIVYSNTCPDTVIRQGVVYINPPVSVFTVQNDCSNKFVKQFTDRSLGAKTWFWEFGDGQTSSEQHPVHTYQSTGQYNVRLTVTSEHCTHTSVQSVPVINETANFTLSDTIICRKSPVQFLAAGINSSYIQSWQWAYGDGTSSDDANKAQYAYTKTGTYRVSLTITDLLGCSSTKNLPLTVYGPTAIFTPSVSAACLQGNVVRFHDASTSDGAHPIVNRIWSYGDQTIDSLSATLSQHSYRDTGNYVVMLKIKDSNGCSDSVFAATPVIIAQPHAAFEVSDTVMCTGKNIRFINSSKGSKPIYQWTFGDGKQSALEQPENAYAATGVYSAKLLVTDQYGCKDSVSKENLITISYPKATFTLSDTVGSCPPLVVNFTNRSSDFKDIAWDFGDHNVSKQDTPSHFYAVPGTFYATLVATGPGGCTDTAKQKIVVKGPSGTFSYDPLIGCNPLTVNFKASYKNNVSFIWDFSDGTTVASHIDSISHSYVTAGDFVPKMILTDAAGCSVPVLGKDTIRVRNVNADFTMNKTSFCDEGTVQFSSQVISNEYITGYQWNFGDGTTSNAIHPEHHYQTPGKYTVQLAVTTENGCSDTKKLTDTLNVYQSPVVEITGDSAACASSPFRFYGKILSGDASQLKWNWDLGNGHTAAIQHPATQTYQTAGDYTLTTIASDNHGCRDTAYRKAVVYAMPTTDAGADRWICRGSFAQLKATGADRYQWSETPSLSCTGCETPLAAPTDKTQYTVTGYTSFGCSLSDSIIVSVHQPFALRVEKGDTICAGKTVPLVATGAEQYTWSPSSGIKNPSAGTTTATPDASVLYTVIAKDNAGCFTDTGKVFIKVWPIPTVRAETVHTLSVGSSLNLKPTYSNDVSRYQWSNAQTLSCVDCPFPEAKPKTETTYNIKVKNDGGCTAEETITVDVICNDGNLFIPNTFSPNADGNNDRFYPRGTGISSIKLLRVFNRWGEVVFSRENFSANDAAAGWDGFYKGAVLSADVYIYTCEVICTNNEVLSYRGDLTLLR